MFLDKHADRFHQVIARRVVIGQFDVDECALSDVSNTSSRSVLFSPGIFPRRNCLHPVSSVCQGQVLDPACSIRCAVHRGIVDDDHVSIGRELDVQFDRIRLLGQRQLERGKRILRCMSRCAAMSKDDRLGSDSSVIKNNGSRITNL
jgi:hypothetical protein